MARPSKADRLPPELRDLIAELRADGRTIDEIHAKLRELSADVGRSGLGAYIKRWDRMRARLQASGEAARAIMAELGRDGADDRMARLNIQMLHAGIMELSASEDGEPVQLDAETAMLLARALRDLASAKKTDQDGTLALKRELAKAAAAEVAKAEREAAATGEKADPLAVLKRIRENVYNIYDD